MHVRLNIGCGQTPSLGWTNYDNSPAVWLARWPILAGLLRRVGLIDDGSAEFAAFCRGHRILYANAVRRIPHASGAVDAIYSSHMIEHLVRALAVSGRAEPGEHQAQKPEPADVALAVHHPAEAAA